MTHTSNFRWLWYINVSTLSGQNVNSEVESVRLELYSLNRYDTK